MSDRFLIVAACVPMLCGFCLLVLLARVPAQASPGTSALAPRATLEEPETGGGPSWVGVVVAANTAELAAPSPGYVDHVYVRTGDTVKKGDRLLQFDHRELSSSVKMADAQLRERASELRRFRARARAAKRRLERLRGGEAWLSKQELERALEEARVAEAELEAARASMGVSRIALKRQRLRAKRQTLLAPFAGTVIGLGADEGDSVREGQVVLRIVGRDRQVRFAIPPDAVPPSGLRRVALELQGDGGVRAVTHVDSVRPEVDPSAQLIFATAPLPSELHKPEKWRPGAPVVVRPLED